MRPKNGNADQGEVRNLFFIFFKEDSLLKAEGQSSREGGVPNGGARITPVLKYQ